MAAPQGGTHELTRYADVVEVLRNPHFLALLHDGTDAFRAGTVRQIDGPAHSKRRKAMSSLLRGEGDQWFRDAILMPTIRRNLDVVLAQRDDDGLARADMVVLVRRAFFQLAASLIGLQGVEDLDSAERLRLFFEPINQAMRSWYSPGDRERVMARGIEVQETFRRRYFEPAWAYHEQLLAEVERGERDAADVPQDLLTLVARGDIPDLAADPDLALREAVTDMLNAGTYSSAYTLLHVLDELLRWFQHHPEDAHRSCDPDFLYRGVVEGLRLHPVVPQLYRVADEDVTLTSGLRFVRGDIAAIDVRPVNRDPEAFGANADRFDPFRPSKQTVADYGMTFGTGQHMCFGLPLILGSTGANGSHVQMLRALFEAGVALDPDDPVVAPGGDLAVFERYPVTFAGTNEPAAW